MVNEHTPEPWEKGKLVVNSWTHEGDNFSNGDVDIYPPLGEAGPVAIARSLPDARRIVAAVNACKGIPTERLEEAGREDDMRATFAIVTQSKDLRDEWRSLKARLAEAERLLRGILLDTGGVAIHNSAALTEALAFLGVSHVSELKDVRP